MYRLKIPIAIRVSVLQRNLELGHSLIARLKRHCRVVLDVDHATRSTYWLEVDQAPGSS